MIEPHAVVNNHFSRLSHQIADLYHNLFSNGERLHRLTGIHGSGMYHVVLILNGEGRIMGPTFMPLLLSL